MRILILSKEAWRNEQNGGNVLSNMFEGFDAEFAQIFCSEGEPNNNICRLYYQMTDRMMVDNILKRKKVGKILNYTNYPSNTKNVIKDYNTVRKLNLDSIRILREITWFIAKWDVNEIIHFAKEFSPDIIFAPCYGNHYMLRLSRLIAKEFNVPFVSYISDDFYSNKQFKFSPIYWVNHFILRKHIRETFRLYDLVYTMTDEQKEQCEQNFGVTMKILRKCGHFDKKYEKKSVNNPIRFVFAGGIYLNRWKTLMALADAMRKINKHKVKMVLDIYTGTEIPSNIKKRLDDGITTKMHKPVSMEKLFEIYRNSDVALHVESFDLKNRLLVRRSFSTKIVDCLDSGCAVMALCDNKQAGYSYLKKNDAAITLADLHSLEKVLQSILNNNDILIEYQRKAFALGRKNHLKENNDIMIKHDFYNLCNM